MYREKVHAPPPMKVSMNALQIMIPAWAGVFQSSCNGDDDVVDL
jgi:hypothetical protein